MCVDMAKILLTFQKQNRPTPLPSEDDLNPGKWAIVQSAYEINVHSNVKSIIEAQSLEVESSIPKTNFNGDFNQVAILITDREGTTVFGIMGDREGHELLWHRDDSNEMWL